MALLIEVGDLLWGNGGRAFFFFFLGESFAYKDSQSPLLARRVPVCDPPSPRCIPSPSPLELPSHCGCHDGERKKSADGETLSQGISVNPRFLRSIAWHLEFSSQIATLYLCMNVKVSWTNTPASFLFAGMHVQVKIVQSLPVLMTNRRSQRSSQ